MGRDLEKGSLDTSDAVPSGNLNVPKQPVSEQHLASWFLVLLNTRETWQQMISLNYLKFRLEQLPVCQWLAIAGVCHCRQYFCICTWQRVLTSFPIASKNCLTMQRVAGWSQLLSYQLVKWEIGNVSLELRVICQAISGILLYVVCLWILGPPSGQGGGSMGLGRYLQFRLCRSGGDCHIHIHVLHGLVWRSEQNHGDDFAIHI